MGAIPIPIAQLIESPLNPRKHFDETKIAELASSLKEKGVLNHLIGRRVADGDSIEVICGHRRLRAARLAELEDLPVEIRQYDDRQAIEIMLIENGQRDDVHPIEEARGYRMLIDEHGYEVAALAVRVGHSESHIYRRLQLLKLLPEVQEAYLAGKIHTGHAELIGRLDLSLQLKALGYAYNDWQGLKSVSQLRDHIKETYTRILETAAFSKSDADLVPSAGSCNACPKRTGSAPALFEDLGRKDTCTDPDCFGKKMNAHFNAKRRELKNSGEEFVQITSHWSNGRDGILDRNHYEEAKPKDKDTVKALITDGPNKGKVLDVKLTERGKEVAEQAKAPKAEKAAAAPKQDSWEKRRDKAVERFPLRKALRAEFSKRLSAAIESAKEEPLAKALALILIEVTNIDDVEAAKAKKLSDLAKLALQDEAKRQGQTYEHEPEDLETDAEKFAKIFGIDLKDVMEVAKQAIAAAAKEPDTAEAPAKKKPAVKKAAKKSPAKKAAKKAVKK